MIKTKTFVIVALLSTIGAGACTAGTEESPLDAVAEDYYRYLELRRQLSYARNEAARDYLDGNISRDEAVAWIRRYQLMSAEEAEQAMDFIETYRAYVINYNLGLDMVRAYVERKAGDDPALRWALFEALLSEPISVADIGGPLVE